MCVARVINNPAPPLKNTELRPCRKDKQCHQALHASPSIAYWLSYKLLNLYPYRVLRHCYWVSPEADQMHMDMLCSFMFREAVYIARRGYFARDLFLEHVMLCRMLGYEEFFRQHWFRKVISWMDAYRRWLHTERSKNINLRKTLSVECHTHPMAVLTVMLAHAIRYTAQLLTK